MTDIDTTTLMRETESSEPVDLVPGWTSLRRTDFRVETLCRLTDGFHHKIREKLACLIVGLELNLDNSSSEGFSKENSQICNLDAQSLVELLSDLGDYVEQLSEIQSMFRSLATTMSAQECAERIGLFLGGALRWTRDNRSSKIDFVSGPHLGGDFPIPIRMLTDPRRLRQGRSGYAV